MGSFHRRLYKIECILLINFKCQVFCSFYSSPLNYFYCKIYIIIECNIINTTIMSCINYYLDLSAYRLYLYLLFKQLLKFLNYCKRKLGAFLFDFLGVWIFWELQLKKRSLKRLNLKKTIFSMSSTLRLFFTLLLEQWYLFLPEKLLIHLYRFAVFNTAILVVYIIYL